MKATSKSAADGDADDGSESCRAAVRVHDSNGDQNRRGGEHHTTERDPTRLCGAVVLSALAVFLDGGERERADENNPQRSAQRDG